MAFRAICVLIILLFSIGSRADELKINPNHPDKYTVVSGDTLWDISGKFLQHPWQWPQLWHNNPQIQDPHWIYPGDTLYFSYVNGAPRLSLSADGDYTDRYGNQKLEPRIRESDNDLAVKIIPPDAIAQFLSSPRVLNKDELGQAPYVISMAGDERLIGGAGDRIYVRAITQPVGLHYTIFRHGEPYISPETHEILGYEAQYIGETTIEATGDPATLLINKAKDQVRQGDRLLPSDEKGVALNYFPRPPENRIQGRVIRVMNGITQIGIHDIVVIDKGAADGLLPGHVLEIFRAGRVVLDQFKGTETQSVKLPDELAGILMVFRPFERVSYALVMEAKGPIHVLDRVQTP